MVQATLPLTTDSTRALAAAPVFHPLDPASQPPAAATVETLTTIPKVDLSALIGLLDVSGVNARRVGSPDLMAQAQQALRRPIGSVICHTLDAEPALSLNAASAANWPVELCAGLSVLAQACKARATLIVPSPAPSWLEQALRLAVRIARLRLAPAPALYPQADATLLLHSLLGRKLRPGRLPTEQGIILLDAAAAIDLGRLLLGVSPCPFVPVLIHDSLRSTVHWRLVARHAALGSILSALHIDPNGLVIRKGDILRDLPADSGDTVGCGELIYHLVPRPLPVGSNACVRCGWCIDACPTRLHPVGVMEAIQHDNAALAEHQGIEACIECGICTYVCPSRLPLMQSIRAFRQSTRSGSSAQAGL